MPRRGDNIRKRKDGRWEARYIWMDSEVNARKYRSVYGKSYQEVKKKRDLIIEKGFTPQMQTRERTFKDILDGWQDFNRVRLKESSISRYQNIIDAHILPTLGNLQMNQLNATTINRFLAAKLENGRLDGTGGLSASYVRSISVIINSAIRYGVRENLCSSLNSPITKPPLQKKELVILSAEKQEILERELLKSMHADKLLIYITLYTGLRIGEICALRWEDIDLEEKMLYVRHTVSRVWYSDNNKKHSKLVVSDPKTQSSLRCIPLCSKLHSILANYQNRKSRGFILENYHEDGPISPRTFEYRYKKIMKAAHLEPVNYHTLRHTFATRCIERGVDIKTISEVLGHANISITLNTYVHSSMELKRIQLEKLIC